jgi:hypothetical protein
VLVCYDFHSRISDKEEDLMFATKLGLFSIGTIVVPTLVRLKQLVCLIPSTCLLLIKHVYDVLVELIFVLFVLSNILVELVSVLLV